MTSEPSRATQFLLAALAWSLGLFALLRSSLAEAYVVRPLTEVQRQAALYYAGSPTASITVTSECSGTDVLALCIAAILACPVPWRARLAGAALGTALVLALNTVRIATLGHAAASPALFQTLHLQVWPVVLVLATGGFVFAWMWGALAGDKVSGRATAVGSGTVRPTDDDALSPLARRFAPRAAVLLVAFALSGPWIARSPALWEAGAWVAGGAAFVLTSMGLTATASGNVLATNRGGFMVTPDCLATALIPIYVAGVLAVRLSWAWRVLALVAALPLFAALAVARLLLLALPPVLAASPLFLVHGFHQLVLAVFGVALVAYRREPPSPRRWSRAAVRTGLALGVAGLLVLFAGPAITDAVRGAARALVSVAPHTVTDLQDSGDAQGALALLPAFQVGLLLALGLTAFAGLGRLVLAFAVLLASQVGLLVLLGEADHAGLVAHALVLRAWAVAVPFVLALLMVRAGRPGAGTLAPLRPAAHAP